MEMGNRVTHMAQWSHWLRKKRNSPERNATKIDGIFGQT